jgi:flagellar protein FlaG
MGVRSVNGQDMAMQLSVSAARAPASTANAGEASERTSTQTRNNSGSGEERAESVTRNEQVNATQTDAVVQRTGTRLRVDKESEQVVAQILDENNEVIRQIPPEEMLDIAARFNELQGKLFDKKV